MDYKPNIAIIGTGYVGLVSSACFAELGFKVIGVDKDTHKINQLINGSPLIYEPTLTELIQKNLSNGKLEFSHSLVETVLNSDIIFITVGTTLKNNTQPDINAIEKIINEIALLLN